MQRGKSHKTKKKNGTEDPNCVGAPVWCECRSILRRAAVNSIRATVSHKLKDKMQSVESRVAKEHGGARKKTAPDQKLIEVARLIERGDSRDSSVRSESEREREQVYQSVIRPHHDVHHHLFFLVSFGSTFAHLDKKSKSRIGKSRKNGALFRREPKTAALPLAELSAEHQKPFAMSPTEIRPAFSSLPRGTKG